MRALPIVPCLAVTAALLGLAWVTPIQDAGSAATAEGTATSEATSPALPIQVFLVRHAEKESTGRDPGLTEFGKRRAIALAELLEDAGITHLYSTDYERTQATLAPLVERTGLEIVIVDARSPQEQLAAIHALPPGSVAVVSGHSNTTPAFVQHLGGDPFPGGEKEPGEYLGEDEYDRLYLVTLPPAGAEEHVAVSTRLMRYGRE